MSRHFDPRTRAVGTVLRTGVANWAQRSLIKSIQYGTITPGANASATATITAVNTANTVVIKIGQSGGSNDAQPRTTRLTLTDSTTVTLNKDEATDANVTAGFVVLEFVPGVVKTIQYGTMTISHPSTSATATITAVNTGKTIVLHNGSSYGLAGTQQADSYDSRVVLTNSTTITSTIRVSTVGNTQTTSFVAVEFY